MEEKSADVIIEADANTSLTKEQARQFALNIAFDITDDIQNHHEEYLKYLEDEASK